MSNDGFDSKIALVTGSSSGIGAATAVSLAKLGYRLIIHGRAHSDRLENVKVEIESLGSEVKTICCDFSDSTLLESFCHDSWALFGRIDVLINNAGGDVLTNEWATRSFADQLSYLLTTDVVATLMLSRCIGGKMLDFHKSSNSMPENSMPGYCSIVNIGWDQAEQGMAGDSGEMFATTKGAIMAMTRSLAQSLAPSVRVNCVAPGWIKTKWGEGASETWQTRGRDESLMDRWGDPQDVANAVSFLTSEDASFVSGQIIPVNGGFRYFQGS